MHANEIEPRDLAHLRAVKDTASVWFWEQDSEFRFTVDKRGRDHVPGERSILGVRRWEVPDCVPLQGTWEDHRRTLEMHLPFRGFEFRVGRGESIRYISTTGVPVYDGEGRFAGYRGTAVDITELKRAHQARERAQSLSLLAARLGHVVGWCYDISRQQVEWSCGIREFLGLDGAFTPQPRKALRLVERARRRELLSAFARCARDGIAFDIETRICLSGDSSRWLRVVGEPLSQGAAAVEQIQGAVQDISGSRQAQQSLAALGEELAALNRDLNTRVQERTRELELVNTELKGFAHALAHDLRSPLVAIDGFASSMAEALARGDSSRCAHYASRIRAGGARMAEYVDALLGLAQTSQAELSFSRVDLSALCIEIVEALRATAGARQVTVDIQPGMVALGDRRLLRILLENLLGNAWKFSSRREQARIGVAAQRDASRGEVFSVRDNGAGFDMAFAGKLFGNFQRLHPFDEFPGTGVGLANAQRIVTRHGGRIWAQSHVGVGATFSFTLTPPSEDKKP